MNGRECRVIFFFNGDIFRLNPALLNRLVPFLQRELNVLIPNSPEMPMYVEAILQKLRHHRINGREFRAYIRQLVGPRHAAHFCHELHAFATSPFDLVSIQRLFLVSSNQPVLVDFLSGTHEQPVMKN